MQDDVTPSQLEDCSAAAASRSREVGLAPDVKELVERLRERGRIEQMLAEDKISANADAGYECETAELYLEAASALTLLSEERDGYRLALRHIADHNNAFLTDGSEATRTCIDHLVEIARSALSSSEREGRHD